MPWAEGIREGLPPPRDDEPPGLRGQIVEELSDHLSCALAQELRHTSDEQAAWRAVLARFGDPRRLARRLWFDAMKEAIMTQRITLAVMGVLAAAAIAACIITWLALEQAGQVNAAILARLEALETTPPAVQPVSDWTELRVKCVDGTKDGKPLAGLKVTINGNAVNPSEAVTMDEKTDSEGLATFGPIKPGKYYLRVVTAWGREHNRQLVLLPGPPHTETVVCPFARAQGEISLSVAWPMDLKEVGLWVQCQFRPAERWSDRKDLYFGGHLWEVHRPPAMTLAPTGELVNGVEEVFIGGGGFGRTITVQPVPETPVRLSVAEYRLHGIVVLQPLESHPLDESRYLRPVAFEAYSNDEHAVFSVKADTVNRWEIPLTDELLEQVRKKLAEEAEAG